jgi:hypothetical protein
MSMSTVRAQLEYDLQWRWEELRFFANMLAGLQTVDEQDRFRKALLLMLYAHFEGFCCTALQLYVSEVNRSGAYVGDAAEAIAAASLDKVFSALASNDRKCAIFRRSLPADTKLHRAAREIDFVSQYREFTAKRVDIPDDVVDSESNLWPTVLRKNLFRLGLRHDAFDAYEQEISRLLSRRNGIAHGSDNVGVKKIDYDAIEKATQHVMAEIMAFVVQAMEQRSYLRLAVACNHGEGI